MAAFGAGTIPAMMGVAYAGRALSIEWRSNLRKAVPVFITLMGLVLILRGMNLGIPFISPMLPGAPGQPVVCHP
jgi:sulfite exporter TauE/SafE